MSEFPKKLSGAALEELHRKALCSLSEDRIGYLRRMLYAMAAFYDIIPVRKAYEILTVNYGEDITEGAFLDLCEYLRYEQKENYYIFGMEEYEADCTDPASAPIDRLIVIETFVEFDDIFYDLLKLKAGKPWYIPAKEEMEKYADAVEIEKNEHYYAFLDFMRSEFKLDGEDAEELVFDAIYGLHMENCTFDDFLNDIQRVGSINITFEQANKIVPYYIALNNNTRKPANNGYTPVETEKLRKEYGFESDSCFVSEIVLDEAHEKERSKKAREFSRKISQMRGLFNEFALSQMIKDPPAKKKKIGRNEPCPCGSGKKYKKCCGLKDRSL